MFDKIEFHKAVKRNDTLKVKSWLSQGANVDMRLVQETPLHRAAKSNVNESHSKMAKILLNNGADANAIDSTGRTPLYYLFERTSNVKIVYLFSNFKFNLN